MNGWQRLGLVASVVLAVFIIYSENRMFPMESRFRSYHDYEVGRWKERIAIIESGNVEAIAFYNNAEGRASLTSLQADIVESDNRLRVQLESLTMNQVGRVIQLFGVWLGICIVTYLGGRTINWIYQGFRSKSI